MTIHMTGSSYMLMVAWSLNTIANWGLAFLFLFTVNKIRFSLQWEHLCMQQGQHQEEHVQNWY